MKSIIINIICTCLELIKIWQKQILLTIFSDSLLFASLISSTLLFFQNEDMQQQIIKETFQLVSKRDDNICNFLEGGRWVIIQSEILI